MKRERRNPGAAAAVIEEGAGGGGWYVGMSDLLLMGIAIVAMAGIIAGERANQAAIAEQKRNPTPENLYLGYSELTPAQKAAVMAAPEDQRQNMVNNFLTPKTKNAGILIDPTFLNIGKSSTNAQPVAAQPAAEVSFLGGLG